LNSASFAVIGITYGCPLPHPPLGCPTNSALIGLCVGLATGGGVSAFGAVILGIVGWVCGQGFG